MAEHETEQASINIRVRVREFGIPPVHDALVIGTKSPIGCEAMRRALTLLHTAPFEHIEVDDPVVQDILIRAHILRRIPRERLVAFVLGRIKPLMGEQEVLHLGIEIDVCVEDQV